MRKIFGFLGALILSFGINFNTRAAYPIVKCLFYGSYNSLDKKAEIVKRVLAQCESFPHQAYNSSEIFANSYFVEKNYDNNILNLDLEDFPVSDKSLCLLNIPLYHYNVVVYVCTSDNVDDLSERLTLINKVYEHTNDNGKVILVTTADTEKFVENNISTAKDILGEKLVEPHLTVIPWDNVGVEELLELVCETSVEQQNGKKTAIIPQPNISESRKACLLL